MRTIYKYPVELKDEFTLVLPAGAHILTVQVQRQTPCVWALVDTEKPSRPRRFRLIGTGHPIDEPIAGHYIGTFQLDSGSLVSHLFEMP